MSNVDIGSIEMMGSATLLSGTPHQAETNGRAALHSDHWYIAENFPST